MDGSSILSVTKFVGTCRRVDTTRALSVGGILPPMGAVEEQPELDTKPPLWAPLLIVPRGHLRKTFTKVDTFARQWGFKIGVFPLLGELTRAIESQLTVC